MNRTLLTLTLLFGIIGGYCLQAQNVNSAFPRMTVTQLDDKDREINATLPKDGRVQVIVVLRPSGEDSPAFDLLSEWQPFLNNLFRKEGQGEKILGGLFEDEGGYDGDIHYVALIPGISVNKVINKMRKEAKPEDKENAAVYPVGKSQVSLKKDELAIFLVHRKGTIVHKTTGPYSQRKYQGIEEKIQEIRDNTR
jgi:hypothetical protein